MQQLMETVHLPQGIYEQDVLTQSPFVSGATFAQVAQIDHPKEGGFLTYFHGWKYPVRGFMDYDAIARCNLVKKYVKTPLKVLSSPFALPLIVIAIILFPISSALFKIWFQQFQEFSEEALHKHYYQEPFYVPPIRELHRALMLLYLPYFHFVKAICTTLENDRAYRYIWQDIFSLPEARNLAVTPIRTVWKLTSTLTKRHHARNWRWFGYVAVLLTVLSPKLRREIKKIAKELDFSKFKLGREDLYFFLRNQEYDVQGMGTVDKRSALTAIEALPVNFIPLQ